MTKKNLLDLYSDYLISSFGQTTATGLSALLNGTISHDSVQRFLAGERQTAADLWRVVKPHIRAIESQEGGLWTTASPKNRTLTKTTLSAGIMTIHSSAMSKASIL